MDFQVVEDGIKGIVVVGGCTAVVVYFLWASFGR
jgi:hypothetical protein